MNLFRISDFQPEYRRSFEDADIVQFNVWTAQEERVGKVVDLLMDDIGQLYYVVVDIGNWLRQKLVLVAPEQFWIERSTQRIYLVGVNKQQTANLPEYNPDLRDSKAIAQQSSLSNQQITHSMAAFVPLLESSAPLEAAHSSVIPPTPDRQLIQPPIAHSTPPLPHPAPAQRDALSAETPATEPTTLTASVPATSTRSTSSAQSSEILPEAIAQATLRLLEERLVISQQRRKVGEVIVRKEIETRIVEVPIRREKLVIEQISPEFKQLAIVDLSSETLADGASALDRAVADDSSGLEADRSSEAVPLETAYKALTPLLKNHHFHTSRVKLVFDDAQLQTEYQLRIKDCQG